MIKNKIALLVLPILVLFLISIVSAQTLVAGKIYNSDFSETIDGASVYVECNNNPLFAKDTTSLGDGTYAVRFNVGLCNVDDNVKVTATKDNLAGEGNGTISECDKSQQNCDDGLVSIVNLNLKEVAQTSNPPSGGSGGRSYYLCGNGKCDSGESITTCPRDCKAVVQNRTATATQTESGTEEQNNTELNNQIPSGTQTGFSRITGAVIGTLGKAGTIGAFIFVIIIIAVAISIAVMKKKRNN